MLELIQGIISKVTGKNNITPDTDFIIDLKLNSFDIINIICEFEDHFDISIPTRDVWQLHKVSDVVEYINKLGLSED